MKILVLNGGIAVGKDTIACKIKQIYGGKDTPIFIQEMKEPLIDAAVKTAGISRKLWDALYEREYKEKPCHYFIINGIESSPRQWLIHISEDVLKPMFGWDIFGKLAARTLRIHPQEMADNALVVFPDGGFLEEISSLIDVSESENFYLARIHRKGFDFKGDSRSFLYLEEGQGNQKDFENTEGLNGLETCVENIMNFVRGK